MAEEQTPLFQQVLENVRSNIDTVRSSITATRTSLIGTRSEVLGNVLERFKAPKEGGILGMGLIGMLTGKKKEEEQTQGAGTTQVPSATQTQQAPEQPTLEESGHFGFMID